MFLLLKQPDDIPPKQHFIKEIKHYLHESFYSLFQASTASMMLFHWFL
jgi:hypothetical protein